MQTVLRIEPDLRLIDGLVDVLSLLGERFDPVEPRAIAAIASSAREPLSRLIGVARHIAATRRRDGSAEAQQEQSPCRMGRSPDGR